MTTVQVSDEISEQATRELVGMLRVCLRNAENLVGSECRTVLGTRSGSMCTRAPCRRSWLTGG
jgi:hypothetical protein